MAKKNVQETPPTSGRVSSAIERVENGFIVRVSSEGQGKNASYVSRTFVAPNGQAAMRIATTHIQAVGPKTKQKKTKTKTLARKR
jgi:hypothetical protein